MAIPDGTEIRVFLSSTFVDFQEERSLLVKQVFPSLRRRAKTRGVEIVDVDLRWGVTAEQTGRGETLPLCLAEIERCRPYFISLLGERYGWVPSDEFYKPQLLESQPWLHERRGDTSLTELEILHAVLRNPSMAGHAFFYLRDPAFAEAQQEEGWVAENPAELQRLNGLKQQIRASGFPVAEGLANPQAIAERIEADLWALIDRQFPEGEQPDALEQEEHKHADYRRSRTRPGEYVGGEGSIEQLERWIEEGEQQILITGESGAGKSALIANWMQHHAERHPGDVVFAHHLGCTNDASALRPLLGRLIDTASRQLKDAELISEPIAVPEDWWELMAKVAETLQTLGRWYGNQGRRWIWVLDGLDRLATDDQTAMPWLPLNLPAGVQVVASALPCGALQILLERGYTSLAIKPLNAQEQRQLIERYLSRYTKQLESGLQQKILEHKLAGSPLFLRVLLEELRQCAWFDTLAEQLDFYLSAQTIDGLYAKVLERLENDGHGKATREALTALWASRAGLSETELLQIRELAPLEWAPVDLALEKAFGRNGNRLVFDHDYLRIAVEDRYLPTEERQRQAHSELADWFAAKEGWDKRDAEELPWQYQQAERLNDLRDHLLNPVQLAYLGWHRSYREAINYWLAIKPVAAGELDELIAEAVEEEIEKRKEDAEATIWFVDRIAALVDEAGLYRGLLLRLRTISLELVQATEDRDEQSMLSSVSSLADAHRDMGSYNQAEPLYLRCLEARERLLGPEHPDTLTTVGNLAGLYQDKGDYEQAEAYYKRDLEATERLLGREHPDTLTTVNNLAIVFIDMGDYEQAEACLKPCLESSERLLGPEHPSTLTIVNNLAGLFQDKGDYEQTEAYYTRCLEARERLLGPEHPDTLITVGNLAGLFQDTGDYEQAEAYYTRCLQARERLLGPEHPSTLTTLNNFAALFRAKGDYEQAEAYYTRCLEALERLLGPEHPYTLTTVGNLANLLSDQERYSESISLRRIEMGVAAKRGGRLAPGTLKSMYRLGQDLLLADELVESEQLLREALAGCIGTLGDDAGATMSSRLGLARCLSALERYSEAIELRRVELAWCQSNEVVEAKNILVSMYELGLDLLATKRAEEALQLLQPCLDQRRDLLGASDDATQVTFTSVLEALSLLGRQQDALRLSRAMHQVLMVELEEDDPKVLNQLEIQASLHEKLGELEQAEVLWRQCLAGREVSLGADHPDTLKTVFSLGCLHETMGDYPKAEFFYQRELDAHTRVLGSEHIHTINSLGMLGNLHKTREKYDMSIIYRSKALSASESKLGLNHPDTTKRLLGLADAYHASRQYKQVINLLSCVLSKCDHRLRDRDSTLIPAMFLLGSAYLSTHRYHASMVCFESVADEVEGRLGLGDEETLGWIDILLSLLVLMGRHDAAKCHHRSVIKRLKGEFDNDHPCFVYKWANSFE